MLMFLDAHILIVDDLFENIMLVRDILDEEGYTNIIGISDPRTVIEHCNKQVPDIILLDIRMPHINGFELLALLQGHFKDALPFIIMLTAENDPLAKSKALQDGAIDFLTKPFDHDELVKKISNFLRYGAQKKRQIAQNKELKQLLVNSIDEISALSIQDPISELPNRHAICLHVLKHYRAGQPLSAVLVSIDGMEELENLHGHSVTEQLFQVVIDLCLDNLNLHEPFLGCWSGYQLMLITHTAEIQNIENEIQRIAESVVSTFAIEDMLLRIKVRIGASINNEVLANESELLKRTIIALPSKQDKSNIRIYSEELEKKINRKNRIKQALSNAIQYDEFHLVYQPKVELGSHKITGAEALIRWQSEHLGFVSPDEFISIAEHTGDILPLGKWVIERALLDLRALLKLDNIDNDFCLAINLSVNQLLEKDFTQMFLEKVTASNIPTKHIQIEITESIMIEDTQLIYHQLNKLRQVGISVALDDFGTGFSSLSYLRELPIDVLKIDRCFIMDIHQIQEAYELVAAIIKLANIFNLKIVAEGIEEIHQADALQKMGCDEAQGYFFAKPMPFNELNLKLAS